MPRSRDRLRQGLLNRLSSNILLAEDIRHVMHMAGFRRQEMMSYLHISSGSYWNRLLKREDPLPSWGRYDSITNLMTLCVLMEEWIKENESPDPRCGDLPWDFGASEAMKSQWHEMNPTQRKCIVEAAEARVISRGWLREITTEQQRTIRRQSKHANHLVALSD